MSGLPGTDINKMTNTKIGYRLQLDFLKFNSIFRVKTLP